MKTGPRLRDDMSIHTKRPSYFFCRKATVARATLGTGSGSHTPRRKSTGGNPFHGQIRELRKRKAQMLWPVPRNGETRRWRRTCRTRLASNI